MKMTRLEKVESFYLNILRVSILVLATVLLIGAILALVYAAPRLLPSVGGSDAAKPASVSLKDYRSESQPSGVTVTGPSTEPAEQPKTADGRIVTAAKNFVAWGRKTGASFEQAQVVTVLDEKQKGLGEGLQGNYADSLVVLSRDVLASTRPGEDINEIINWHHQKFVDAEAAASEAVVERAAKTAADRAAAFAAAGAAGAGFLLFLMLLFVFVLVKIERNLRLVHVEVETPVPAA